jgi:hypothetical protein
MAPRSRFAVGANFTVFPANFIAKRYLGRQTNFISASYDDLVQTAESIG